MKNLRHKAVFITGGGAGLGKAMAERFLAEGAAVTIADRDARSEAVAAELGAGFMPLDVTDAAAFEAAVNALDRLDVLINNAGIGTGYAPVHEADTAGWNQVIGVNLTGVFLGMKFGLARMMHEGNKGVVLNISSITGVSGFPNVAAYSTAKAGVSHLTRSAALEYGPHGIRINAIAPTFVLTPLMERSLAADPNAAETLAYYQRINPMPGMPEPEDIAAAAAFLASDDARFITGVILPVDGGYTAR